MNLSQFNAQLDTSPVLIVGGSPKLTLSSGPPPTCSPPPLRGAGCVRPLSIRNTRQYLRRLTRIPLPADNGQANALSSS